MFKGVCTALITPFDTDGTVDYESFERLVEAQISGGIDALLFLGSTGEPSTMTIEEEHEILRWAIPFVNKRVPVMVGIGSNNTLHAVENAVNAQKLGADMLLAVTPYYNKCTQNGVIEYFKAICGAVSLPVIAYNIPGRTGVNILPATFEKMKGIKNLAGIKEACGNVAQIMETARLTKGHLAMYSGDDPLCLPILSLGADGLISVASNIMPAEVVEMVHAFLDGDTEKSRNLQYKYMDLFNALFCEVNPIPVKYAASKLGLCKNYLRPPLTLLEKDNGKKLDDLMAEVGLI